MESQCKLVVGSRAPEFKGDAYHDQLFKTLTLDSFKGKWLVLFFYPLDFTFVCPTEIKAFNAKCDDFRKIGCELVGCSIDSKFVHRQWTMTPMDQGGIGPLKFPLLSDLNHEISTAYNCLIKSGGDKGVALRATYIIDPTGTLCCFSQNQLPVGRNINEIFRLVQACQFHAENGDVCPGNWQKGGPTMQASHDSEKTKAYWEKEHAKK